MVDGTAPSGRASKVFFALFVLGIRAMSHGFSHGLCDCCNGGCGACFLPSLCYSCQVAKLHSHVLRQKPPRCYRCVPCTLCLLGTFAFPPLLCLQHCYVRGSLVDELKAEETACEACLVSTMCGCCSVVQLADTLVTRGVPARIGMDDAGQSAGRGGVRVQRLTRLCRCVQAPSDGRPRWGRERRHFATWLNCFCRRALNT